MRKSEEPLHNLPEVELIEKLRELNGTPEEVLSDTELVRLLIPLIRADFKLCFNSIACLRKRGKHIQVGLLLADQSWPALPMDQVLSKELEIIGSHGMQAHRYPAMLEMIRTGQLRPGKLLGRTISLDEVVTALPNMHRDASLGVTVINSF